MPNSRKTIGHVSQSGVTENTPYVGPRPFTRADKDIFFGRNQEAIELTSLIKAHPEVLLYAPSGAGKTSLLFAQVIPILDEEEEFDVLPTARVRSQESSVIPEDKINNIYMFNAFKDLSDDKLSVIERSKLTLLEYLEQLPRPLVHSARGSQAGAIDENPEVRLPRVIIFDQFEEIFTLYPERYKDREDFFSQVAAALEADPFLRVIFSMREDYIAEFDPFVDILPHNLRTRFRLERLRKSNALSAVKQPLVSDRVKGRRQFEPGAAELLIDRLMLIKVKAASGEKIEVPGEFVDPVQLQVVCQTLWEKLPPDDHMISEADLDKYANVEEALSNFYENSVRKAVIAANNAIQASPVQATKPSQMTAITEGAVRGWFEQKLITREGKRNMVFREGEMTAGMSNIVVDALDLQHVIRVEIRGGEPWYELSHDRFIPPIRESNRRFLLQQPLAKRKAQELEARADEWLKSQRSDSLLLNRAELLEAQDWMRSETAAIGYSETLFSLIRASEAAIEHEDNKQQQMLAEAQRRQVVAEQRRSRQMKFGLVIATILLVFTLTSTGVAINRWRQANTAQTNATQNYNRAQLALAEATVARDKERLAGDRERDQRVIAEDSAAKLKIEKKKAEDAADNLEIAKSKEKAERIKAEDARKRAEVAGDLAKREKAEADILRRQAEANRNRAEQDANDAKSAKLAGDARSQLSTDPELSLRLSILAFDLSSTEVAASSLRQAYLRFKGRSSLRGHEDVVRKAVYSPDGQFIFTASDDMTIKMWDVKTNTELKSFTGHKGGIHALAISSDGTRIATEAGDNTGRIWNVSEGSSFPLEDLTGPVAALAFSKDGRLIATEATSDKEKPGAAPRIWDVATGARLQTLQGHSQAVSALTFSPKGNLLATASWDSTARIWDVSTGRQLFLLKGHTAPLASVAFSPNGALVVTGSYDGTLRVWSADTGEVKTVLTGHTGVVHGVEFSPNGEFILTRGKKVRAVEQMSDTEIPLPPDMLTDDQAPEDNTVRLWNVESGRSVRVITGHTGDVNSATFSTSGDLIATASEDGTVRVWKTETGIPIAELRPASGKAQNSAVLSPDEKDLVTAGADLTTQVWRIDPTERKAQFRAHQGPVLSVKFSPDDESVVTSGKDGERRWTAAKGTPKPGNVDFPLRTYAPSGVAISPDGKFVVTASKTARDFSAHVWDTQLKAFPYELAGHSGPVIRVYYSPKGNFVVTISRDGTFKVWETVKWTVRSIPPKQAGEVNAERVLCASFSKDERFLATGQIDGKVRIWDVLTGENISEFNEHEAAVNSVTFDSNSDSPLVVSTSSDATVQRCGALTEKCLPALRGHTGSVQYAEFSQDGSLILTVGIDRAVRVWGSQNGKLVAEFRGFSESLKIAAFNSDNTEIVAGGQNGDVFVLRCDVCRPIEAVKERALKLNPRELTMDENLLYLFIE